jgi:hypothetical protein
MRLKSPEHLLVLFEDEFGLPDKESDNHKL